MFIVTAAKIFTFCFAMFPIAGAAIATGLIFSAFLIGVARNPAEKDTLFSNSMVAFVIVESFVFTALLVCVLVWFLLKA